MDYAHGRAILTETCAALNMCNINLFSMFYRALDVPPRPPWMIHFSHVFTPTVVFEFTHLRSSAPFYPCIQIFRAQVCVYSGHLLGDMWCMEVTLFHKSGECSNWRFIWQGFSKSGFWSRSKINGKSILDQAHTFY